MPKPNVIFIFSDQQRWDTIGCYGQKLDVTPNLDKFAQKGVMFENTFTCQPVCGPARACIQTGKYATETGCYRNGIALKPDEKTIAKYFTENGYETGYIGKWHLASTVGDSNEDIGERFDNSRGPVPENLRGGYKDYWLASDALEFTSHGYNGHMFDGDMKKVEFKGYRADRITDFALNYLKNRKSERPFFLFLSYIEPHHQNDRFRYEGPRGSKQKFKDFEVPGDLAGQKGDWKQNYPDYLGCCNSLDYNFGRLMEELSRLGIAGNTVVFYTSDHGSHFRTRNNEYKRSCHDACARVPMVAFGPGFEGGKTVKELVSLIDIPPTLLACAKIKKPKEMRGNPLQKLVDEKKLNWPGEVFMQISESQVGRAIRTKKWKYSVCAFDKSAWKDSYSLVYNEEYLYDLENDPFELKNLMKDPEYALVRKELAKILKKKMRQAGEKPAEINAAL
ncbi:MAG: sulfatase-like hydrolase/transferase [Eubacteriales bacterium]